MSDKFNQGLHSLDHQTDQELQERTRKSAERSELREQLLRKLARPTKVSKAADKLTTEEAILEQLREINRKLGDPDPARANALFLTQRAMGVKPSYGSVPPAPKQDHQNAADCPPALLAEWLRGRIL